MRRSGVVDVIAFRGRVSSACSVGVMVLVVVAAGLAWQQYDDSRARS